ncbi:hypothetical protein HZH68_001176 [Vespula germanica]|uniref:Uncharacterized protein n=1 Tax=Vespula germanica TaxID=30212 RepID=A0A834NUY3_VESGE|nr:hypothetical protein HZH68_001176 [Vespula germanica]
MHMPQPPQMFLLKQSSKASSTPSDKMCIVHRATRWKLFRSSRLWIVRPAAAAAVAVTVAFAVAVAVAVVATVLSS